MSRRDAAFISAPKKPLIEQAITQERIQGNGKIISKENIAKDGTVVMQAKPYHRQVAIALSLAQTKYRWTASAVTMCEYLTNGIQEGERVLADALPFGTVWIEFEQAIIHPSLPHKIQAIAILHTTKNHILNPLLSGSWEHNFDLDKIETWTLILFDALGGQWWNVHLLLAEDGQLVWAPTDFHVCPSGQCHTVDDDDVVKFVSCEACMSLASYWMTWSHMASLMVSGTFQEHEEGEIEETTEKAIRKVARADRPHKFREMEVEHRYRIIRFDACTRKTVKKNTAQALGSWIKAINPNAILYVDRHIAKTKRTLRHERYINKRGQTISVKAHDKRIPMKVSELRRKITRVVASKFESVGAM